MQNQFSRGQPHTHGLPYDIVGQPRARTLVPSDFMAEQQIIGRISNVASLEIARGHSMILRKDAAFQAYFYAGYEVAITPDAAVTYTVDLGAAGFKIAQSTRPAPALPALNHPDVLFDISSDGGTTWTTVNVTAINFTTNVVTGAKVAGTNRVRVRYLPADGTVQLAVIVPQASDASQAVLVSKPLRALFEADQGNIRTGTRLELERNAFLPAEFVLAWRVECNSKILWGDPNSILALPCVDVAINPKDKVQLWRMAETELKGTGY